VNLKTYGPYFSVVKCQLWTPRRLWLRFFFFFLVSCRLFVHDFLRSSISPYPHWKRVLMGQFDVTEASSLDSFPARRGRRSRHKAHNAWIHILVIVKFKKKMEKKKSCVVQMLKCDVRTHNFLFFIMFSIAFLSL